MIHDYISFLGAFGSSEVGCWLPTSTCQRRYQRVGDLTFKWIQDISTTFSFSVVFRWIEVDLLISLSGKLQSWKLRWLVCLSSWFNTSIMISFHFQVPTDHQNSRCWLTTLHFHVIEVQAALRNQPTFASRQFRFHWQLIHVVHLSQTEVSLLNFTPENV